MTLSPVNKLATPSLASHTIQSPGFNRRLKGVACETRQHLSLLKVSIVLLYTKVVYFFLDLKVTRNHKWRSHGYFTVKFMVYMTLRRGGKGSRVSVILTLSVNKVVFKQPLSSL